MRLKPPLKRFQRNPCLLRQSAVKTLFFLILLIPSSIIAIESQPPILPQGEPLENIAPFIDSISQHSPVYSIAFSPDGRWLASGSDDSTVRLWGVDSRKEIRRFEGHSNTVNSVAFSPDGRWLASGSSDNIARLWDVDSGQEIKRYEGHSNSVNSVAFSPDGRWLASGSSDNTARLWDVDSGQEIKRYEGHSNAILTVSFSPNGKLLASGSRDETVRLWEVDSGQEISRYEGHSSYVNFVSFSPDGKLLASGSPDRTLRLWDVDLAQETSRFEGHSSAVLSVRFSPDGKLLALGTEDRAVTLRAVNSGQEIRRFEGHSRAVLSVCFSPNGRLLASGSIDKTIRLWDVGSGKEIKRIKGHSSRVLSVSFSPDSNLLASGAADNTVRVWTVNSGQEIRRFEGQGLSRAVLSISFSPDGRLLASGFADGTIVLWNVDSGQEIKRFKGHPRLLTSVSFSPGGKRLASGSYDNTVLLWGVDSGKKIRRFEGHLDSVQSVCFNPDGRWLASGSSDNIVRLWDVDSGKEIRRFVGHSNSVWSVAFSPDGRQLASGSYDNTVRLWDVDSGETLWIYAAGQMGNWLTCDFQNNRCFRYDDGTFLVRNEGGTITSIPFPKPNEDGKLSKGDVPAQLTTHDGVPADFSFQIQNTGQGNIYWLTTVQETNPDNPLIFYPPKRLGVLRPDDDTPLACKVSTHSPYKNPKPRDSLLRFHITSAHAAPIPIEIPVRIRVPDIQLQQAELQNQEDKRTLQVTLQNTGEQDLDANADFQIKIGDTLLKTKINRDAPLRVNETAQIAFNVPSDLDIPEDAPVTLIATKNVHPMHVWETQKAIILPTPPWQLYAILSGLLLVIVVSLYYLRLYLHPMTLQFSRTPETLPTLPLDQLPKAASLLRRTRRLDATLSAADIHKKWLNAAIAFSAAMPPEERCRRIADRLGVDPTPLSDAPFEVYRFPMGDDFPLNMETGLLAFPSSDLPAADALARLRRIDDTRFHPCLIVSTDPAQAADLRKTAKNPDNWFVVPNGSELTALLLSPAPQEELARRIAAQVKITRISPYQTRGGVKRESAFFGRSQLLAQILQREPANYLLVGGRQLGKSTLLKAIERRCKDDPTVDCHYLVLSGEGIAGHLAVALGLPPDAGLPDIQAHLTATAADKRRLFLIDEADVFVAAEAQTGYKTLHQFRSLSEEGRCHFILAGFWTLYAAAAFDYQSPVKNFAETLYIGALERDACRDLATVPMGLLNVGYASDDLVETLIHETGGRANLIAIACDAMLQNLDMTERVIREDDLRRALDSDAIRSALTAWEHLTDDEADNRLNRIIVYATAGMPQFTLRDLVATLENQNFTPTPDAIRRTLTRLELAFILKREENTYSYCVPLFRRMILEEEPALMIRGEIKDVPVGES